MDTAAISQLSHRLQEQVSSYTAGDERQRQKLLATSTELLKTIETPSERIARMCYADIYLFVAARLLIDLDIFRILSNAKTPLTVAQLAQKSGADDVLLGRLLKHVCTQSFVQETGPDEYTANGVTDKVA